MSDLLPTTKWHLYGHASEIHRVQNLITGTWVEIIPPHKLTTKATDIDARKAEVEAYVQRIHKALEIAWFMGKQDPTHLRDGSCMAGPTYAAAGTPTAPGSSSTTGDAPGSSAPA